MEIRTLKTFLAVAEFGTISQTARRLNSVQSNITSRIKALEEELGVALFVRSRTGMALTAAGELFQSHAQAVIDAEARAIAAVADFSSAVKFLRIGSMESTLAIRLPSHIAAFRSSHGDVKIHITSGPTDDLVAQVLDAKIDIAFIGGAYRHPSLEGQIVFREEMVLVSDKSIVDVSQAGVTPVIVFKRGCTYRAYAEDWMKRSGLAPNEAIELGTLDGILGCVASGVGVSLLPRSVVDGSRHRDFVNVHAIKDDDRFIDTIAIRNIDVPVNGAVVAFLAQLGRGALAKVESPCTPIHGLQA